MKFLVFLLFERVSMQLAMFYLSGRVFEKPFSSLAQVGLLAV